MVRHTLKILQKNAARCFKVYLAILRHYALKDQRLLLTYTKIKITFMLKIIFHHLCRKFNTNKKLDQEI